MWIVLCTIAVCYLLEFVRPVVPRMPVASWLRRVWSVNALQALATLVVMPAWVGLHAIPGSLLGLSARLSPLAAGVVAYLVYTFVFYWWHRARHRSDRLWRVLHQIHHSPRRLEMVTAFYKHPVETVVNGAIAGVLMFPVLGLDVRAAALCVVLAGIADVVYHANIRTPRWLGWFVQRPEMHRLHHESDRHEGNYGDLPLWDWLFGTLRSPAARPVDCGFTPAREERLPEMLIGVDVHRRHTDA